MRYLVVVLWSLVIGQIVAFLGASLNGAVYNFPQAVMGSVLVALVVILIGEVSQPAKQKSDK